MKQIQQLRQLDVNIARLKRNLLELETRKEGLLKRLPKISAPEPVAAPVEEKKTEPTGEVNPQGEVDYEALSWNDLRKAYSEVTGKPWSNTLTKDLILAELQMLATIK